VIGMALFVAAVVAQSGVTALTHSPLPGTDGSTSPVIQLDFSRGSFYLQLLQRPQWIFETAFASVAILLALWRRHARAIDLAVIGGVFLLILSGLFTLKEPRYALVIYPILHLLAAAGVVWTVESLAASDPRSQEVSAWPGRTGAVSLIAGTGLGLALILAAIVPIRLGSPVLAAVLGAPYQISFADIDRSYSVIAEHRQPGDLIVSGVPFLGGPYYLGQVDYVIPEQGATALYLTQRHNRIEENASGTPVIVSGRDFDVVLGQHRRVWLVMQTGPHFLRNNPSIQSAILQRFSLYWAGSRTNVYLYPAEAALSSSEVALQPAANVSAVADPSLSLGLDWFGNSQDGSAALLSPIAPFTADQADPSLLQPAPDSEDSVAAATPPQQDWLIRS
jgi:hypothetical protein